MLRFSAVTKHLACLTAASSLFIACTPPKAAIPSLTPQAAASLLQMTPKSKNWLERVKKENPACEYKIELPDQSSHPTVIDIEHAIKCGTQPAPRALNATITYTYDKAAGHWVISRFAS